MIRYITFAILVLLSGGQPRSVQNAYESSGRVAYGENGRIILVGSASSLVFDFEGDHCSISLQSIENHHNYVSLELDGEYIGRVRIDAGPTKEYTVKATNANKSHTLRIYKSTEAANGNISFNGAKADKIMATAKKAPSKKIEFIGDSITCGMGNDAAEYPCGSGEWFDQHNAYWAYGPIVSRSLGSDFALSSVSGYGMYRNWNDEHQYQPILPEVYENLFLDTNTSQKYDSNFQPDLVSICLGTNDLSEGDGVKPRLPFNEKKYIVNYIDFINTIYKRYPKCRIAVLNSPMISGQKNEVLVKCLREIIAFFKSDSKHKPIALFEFQNLTPHGCGYHPDIDDHRAMAAQLEPFLKKILNEK